MTPNAATLSGYVNKTFTLNKNLYHPHSAGAPIVKAFEATVDTGGGLEVKAGSGTGFWVPYIEGKAVVGFNPGGKTWVASGPFSGCIFSVGKDSSGKIYAAHIAVQSGSTGPADWDAYRSANKLTTWYENKIPLPSDTFFSGAYIFACFGSDGLTSLTRVDVNTGSQMGGSNGTIFNVKKFK